MPAPQGNTNAATHGKYSFLAIGSLPPGASYIRKLLGQFQRQLEAATLDRYGEISTFHAATIQTAVRHEGRAQLLTKWLRERIDDMTHSERLGYLKEIGNASDARDRCLKQLGFDRAEAGDVIATLYGPHGDASTLHDSEADEPTSASVGAA